jgi:OOP family OmpA-OmpF porin
MRAAVFLPAVLGALAGAVSAREAPPLPPLARQVIDTREAPAAVKLPVTPWQAGEAQAIRAEGAVRRQVWQIPQPGLTLQQLMAPIRAALEERGFTVLLDCTAAECGGFRFRFATDALPPPEMFVDLGRYRFLSAQSSGPEGPRWRAVMVSATEDRGFVQLTSVDPALSDARSAPETETVPETAADAVPAPDAAPEPAAELARRLEADGHAVLSDVAFATGATDLGPGPLASLDALAAWLGRNSEARVALVGHTDTEGGLAANVELSRRRAAAVRQRLIAAHGIAPGRLTAEGVGYLAPRAPNATEAGREANRRVEVVVVGGG